MTVVGSCHCGAVRIAVPGAPEWVGSCNCSFCTKAGWLLATEGCLPSSLGARVRLSGGKLSVTDGPFTESKEIVGGFAILQANSKREAVELVEEFLQVAGDGECEVRQVFEAGQDTCAQGAAKA